MKGLYLGGSILFSLVGLALGALLMLFITGATDAYSTFWHYTPESWDAVGRLMGCSILGMLACAGISTYLKDRYDALTAREA